MSDNYNYYTGCSFLENIFLLQQFAAIVTLLCKFIKHCKVHNPFHLFNGTTGETKFICDCYYIGLSNMLLV